MASAESLTETATSVEGAPSTDGFVGRFGLDPWLLLAQAVNFLVVLLVLRRFVFRPVLRLLRERQAKVAQGLADAEAAVSTRAAAEVESRRRLAEAAAEAARVRQRAEEEAHRIREELLRRAEEEAAVMHDRAERESEELKRHAVRAAAGEVGNLVVDVAERVLAAELTEKDRNRYREAALRTLEMQAR